MRLILIMSVTLASSLGLNHLYGSLENDGFRLQIWRGRSARKQRLDIPLLSNTLTFALSLAGTSHLEIGPPSDSPIPLHPEQAFMLNDKTSLRWNATGGQRILVLEFTRETLGNLTQGASLRPELAKLLATPESALIPPFSVPQNVLALSQQLSHPPRHIASLPVWYRAKVMEIAAVTFCIPKNPPPDDSFPGAPQRQARETIDRVTFLLERDLENPPSLDMLASDAGCSSFQLSRMFAAHMAQTIPEFVRRKRMERAASMLSSSRLGVSEIAITVGYTSFSAFTRGFVREFGMTPSSFRKSKTAD